MVDATTARGQRSANPRHVALNSRGSGSVDRAVRLWDSRSVTAGRRSAAAPPQRGGHMRRHVRGTLGALLAIGIALAVSAPAAAQTSGNETFSGVIVTSGLSGTRVVVSSVVVAEVQNLPGDPDNVSRDDLVFADGTLHIVSTTLDFSVSLNPRSCTGTATLQQTGMVVGGTGQFAAASGSYTATVTGRAVLARNPDASCTVEQAPLHEVDMIASSGSLSF